MSLKSSSSKGRADPEALLDDHEDLDYEPDVFEELEEEIDDPRIQVPEPSGQEFQETSSNNTSSGKRSYGADFDGLSTNIKNFRSGKRSYGADFDGPSTSIKSFRFYDSDQSVNNRDQINYLNLHIDVDKGSCRSKYGSYSKTNESYHLDSSDEEDVEPQFSDGEYERNDCALSVVSFGAANAEDYACIEPLADPNYVGPESPTQEPALYCEQGYESDSTSYGNMVCPGDLIGSPSTYVSDKIVDEGDQIPISMVNQETLESDGGLPKPKRKSLNFTVQVTGGSRVCYVPTKVKRKPWFSHVKGYLPNIVLLNSLDDVIKFCPIKEHSIGTPSLASNESQNSDSFPGSVFKVPLKRPPTRQKSIKSLSVSIDQMGTKIVKEADDNNYDVISLIASTTIGDDQEDPQIRNAEVKSEPLISSKSPTDLHDAKMNRISEWVERTSELKVPPIYKGLCFKHFFYNNCRNNYCNKSHFLISPVTRISNMPRLSDDQLIEAYNFAKSRPNFYAKIYTVFAEIFGNRDNKQELISMCQLIFEDSKIPKVEGLGTVLKNLQKTDLGTFEASVDYLLMEVGIRSFVTLGEVLIEIIITMNNLPRHWPILRRLFIAGEKVPLRLARLFLVNLMKDPVDVKVCQDVYQHILKYKCLDLPSIMIDIREPFLKLCTLGDEQRAANKELEKSIFHNLSRVRQNFERANESHENSSTDHSGITEVVIPTDFSVPPPNLPIFGRIEMAELRKPPVTGGSSVFRYANSPMFANSNSNSQLDFASLSRQPLAFNLPNSNIIEEGPFGHNSNVPRHDFSRQPPSYGSNISIPRSICSSSDDEEPALKDRFSDSDSSEPNPLSFNPAASTSRPLDKNYGLKYNREGLQYDPANDYVPPPKRRHTKRTHLDVLESARNVNISNFDRLLLASGPNPTQETSCQRVTMTGSEHHTRSQKRKKGAAVETLVSSSSDPQSRKEKPPEHPLFGELYFDPNYEFNISLHNMYLQKIDNVDIDEDDVHILNECIKKGNGKEFLGLIAKYSKPVTIQNFISMTLAHLKGFLGPMVARAYKILLARIEEHNPFFYGYLKVRVVLEVITMNLLFELERRNLFKDAKDLLIKFSNWDSLITSRLFITNISTEVSIVGRYLFIAKLLVFTKPELSYEILVCPNFHFLGHYQKWPYHPPLPTPEVCNADLQARNMVLAIFLKNAFRLNAVVVIQLYKMALRRKGGIWSFDVKPFVDPMISELLNREDVLSLKQIYHEIDLFFKFMEKDTIRAFLIIMSKHLSKPEIFSFFEKAVDRNVYKRLVRGEVLEYNIQLKTTTHEREVELIISYYFHKLVELRNIPPGTTSLKFEIKVPAEIQPKTLSVLNVNKSLAEIKETIRGVLKSKCFIDSRPLFANIVEVEKTELIRYLEDIGGNRT